MEYNIKHEKLLTKRLKSSTIVNCNENKKLIEVINKMKDNKVYLTDEGFLELEEELNELKNVKRPEVIKALKELGHLEIYLRMLTMMLLEQNKHK